MRVPVDVVTSTLRPSSIVARPSVSRKTGGVAHAKELSRCAKAAGRAVAQPAAFLDHHESDDQDLFEIVRLTRVTDLSALTL